MAEEDSSSMVAASDGAAEGLSSREAELRQEIEQLKYKKAVLEEKYQFEFLDRLKAEDKLQEYMMMFGNQNMHFSEKFEREKEKAISLKRKLKEEKKGKRKLKEKTEFFKAENISLLESVTKLVTFVGAQVGVPLCLHGENRQLNQGSAANQTQVSSAQSYTTSPAKRASGRGD